MNRTREGARSAQNILGMPRRINTYDLAGGYYSELAGIVTLSESNEPEHIEYSGPEPDDDDLPLTGSDAVWAALAGILVMLFISGLFAFIVWVKS